MKKVNFIEKDRGTHFEYHLACGDGFLDDSLFYKEFKLKQKSLDHWCKYLWDSGITDLGTNENIQSNLQQKTQIFVDNMDIKHQQNF